MTYDENGGPALHEDADHLQNDSRTCEPSDPSLTQPRSPDVLPRKFADRSISAWGYTYFVRRGEIIKIGHSAIPKQRFSALQVSFPDRLTVLAIVPNTIISEGGAHKKFAHLRVAGEWFRSAPDLLEFIEHVKMEAEKMPKKELLNIDRIRDVSHLTGHLARLRPLYPNAAPIISNLIGQLAHYAANPDALRPMILKSLERIEREIA